jgi:hypothetical protein
LHNDQKPFLQELQHERNEHQQEILQLNREQIPSPNFGNNDLSHSAQNEIDHFEPLDDLAFSEGGLSARTSNNIQNLQNLMTEMKRKSKDS